MNQLFWNAYRRLEKEVLALSEAIHFDDSQLGVYSSKIGDLLVRTVIEIESLSKVLYFANGGTQPAGRSYVYFDTDCLALLESKWKIGKKVIQVSSPYLYFDKEKNKILTPLYKASKCGDKSAEWMRAYQAVKHDRVNNLRKGNIKNLLNALGALFVLNIYYRDATIENVNDKSASNIDWGLGSELFTVKVSPESGGASTNKIYEPKADYEESIYLVKHTDLSASAFLKVMKDVNDQVSEETAIEVRMDLKDRIEKGELDVKSDGFGQVVSEEIKKRRNNIFTRIVQRKGKEIGQAYSDLKYEAVLNKQQF